MKMTQNNTRKILKNEQVGRKMFLEGQLQMVVIFAEIFKPKYLYGHDSSIGGNI